MREATVAIAPMCSTSIHRCGRSATASTIVPPLPGGGDPGRGGTMVDAVAERPHRWMDVLHIGAIATVASLIYVPSMTNPLRVWDHHIILLFAKAPQVDR